MIYTIATTTALIAIANRDRSELVELIEGKCSMSDLHHLISVCEDTLEHATGSFRDANILIIDTINNAMEAN